MSELKQKKNKRKRSIWHSIAPVLIALVLIGIAGGIFLLRRYMPSKEPMDMEVYFGKLSEGEVAVVLPDHIAPERGIVVDGALYLDKDLVARDVNAKFFWDEENHQMLYTTALSIYEIPVGGFEYRKDGKTESFSEKVLLEAGDRIYVSAAFVQQYTNMEWTMDEEQTHVLIWNQWGTVKTVSVKKADYVRVLGGIKSPVLTKANKGDTLYVLDEMEDWTKVVTKDGYIGYIRNKSLTDVQETLLEREFEEEEYTSLTSEDRITLVWHQTGQWESNDYLLQDTAQMTGVDVISPTWYSITDNYGTVASLSSSQYVEEAHAAGWQVWALVDNFSPDMDTYTLLNSTQSRRRVINFMMEDALEKGIDGINVDFEYLEEENGPGYLQFMREISIACRKNGLVLSVDVPVPMEFNRFFGRKELGILTDYVIIMGYDEHYVGSEAGSVASLAFEENGIIGTLKEVPAGKILSGVPTYTRLWYSEETAEGSYVVGSDVLGMSTVFETLEDFQVTPTWDDMTDQNYAAWYNDGILCQVWMEDEESLAKKARLVDEYDLGGIAVWALGYETEPVWEVLEINTNK